MNLEDNIILNSDSYKYSQWNQYPANTEYVYSYISSRGGVWDATLWHGMQGFIKRYLAKPITMEMIDEAEEIITAHGEPFYREGWEYIVTEHGGKLPVLISSAPEGLIIPTGNVLATIVNTDPKCWWLTSFLETAILRAVWYPTTVATNSYESKKIILHYLEKNGDPSLINFKLHDFGARGVSSEESAAIGGTAHLINFMGTDTVSALRYARKYYGANMAGFSIPAMEHSTVTSWGKDQEFDSYRNMLKLHGRMGAPIAFVSDSYNIFEACEKGWGGVLKEDVIGSGAVVVVRPDSGNPSEVVVKCMRILEKAFGCTRNEQGYKVLNHVRIIQGDGIDHATIRSILFCMDLEQFSADNVAFGQGGALLQQVNRDTLKFAMKCSAVGIRQEDGTLEWRDVFKDPVTDKGKSSLKGRVTLYKKSNGKFYTDVIGLDDSELKTVFENGELKNEITLDEIRANTQIPRY